MKARAGGFEPGVDEGPREECGLAGAVSSEAGAVDGAPPSSEAARTVFFGLFALQHRGQEAAGIAALEGRHIRLHKDTGLVSQVFRGDSLAPLVGGMAIGHTRYSTTGASTARNAQPFVLDTRHGPIAVAHNGNLTNAGVLRRALLERGVGLSTASDSEVLAMMLAASPGEDWPSRIAAAMASWEGADSRLVLTVDGIYALRDPWGFRPLAAGSLPDGGWAVASESSALRVLGCSELRELERGEILRLGRAGLDSFLGLPARSPASCSFEYVYFSRPDGDWNGRSIHAVRRRLGELLAEEAPAEADAVIPVPDSAIASAIGYAAASGLPYDEGLVKNRYIGRTFIEPTSALRKQGVALKFNTLPESVRGRRLVLVDDSIVRGTTTGPLVALLRAAGAREVHLRIASPPIRHPCFMGVDMGSPEELIAAGREPAEIARLLGADSLAYLSLEGLRKAIGTGGGCCEACFNGAYPLAIEAEFSKEGFEGGRA